MNFDNDLADKNFIKCYGKKRINSIDGLALGKVLQRNHKIGCEKIERTDCFSINLYIYDLPPWWTSLRDRVIQRTPQL